MTERERWIVYPLLFLALGAALRDKVIKTTQSQRIKCQGLYVVDKDENPILILGAEQFPELRFDAPDLLRVDAIESQRVSGKRIIGNEVLSDRVSSKRYAISEGNAGVQFDARHAVVAVQLLDWVQSIAQRLQALQQLQLQQKAATAEGPPPASEANTAPAGKAEGQSTPAEPNPQPPTAEPPAAENPPPAENPPATEPQPQ